MIEHFFDCPYCWTRISMLIDPSIPEQAYVEDCERCCNPISIVVHIAEDGVLSLSAEKGGQ